MTLIWRNKSCSEEEKIRRKIDVREKQKKNVKQLT